MRLLFTFILFSFCAASNAQIPSYVPTNGLVGWWPFNGNANDESGNGNNGIVNGAILSSDRFENPNSAYSFNGISSFIESTNINLINNLTISCWVKPRGNNGSLVSKSRDDIGSSGYEFIYNNSNRGLYGHVGWSGIDANNIFPSPIRSLRTNIWNHCTITVDNLTARIYLDGNLIHTKNNVNRLSQNQHKILFGKSVWGGNLFDGLLDDIRIYSRALTQSEITYLTKH
jgi:hypothetical protein